MGIMDKHVKQAQIAPVPALALPADDVLPFKSLPAWIDPRPDLKADSELWFELLRVVGLKDEKFQGILNYFRSAGTRIKAGKQGWILRPDIDTTGRNAWSSQGEYNEFKEKYLMPWIGLLGKSLEQLVERYPVPKE